MFCCSQFHRSIIGVYVLEFGKFNKKRQTCARACIRTRTKHTQNKVFKVHVLIVPAFSSVVCLSILRLSTLSLYCFVSFRLRIHRSQLLHNLFARKRQLRNTISITKIQITFSTLNLSCDNFGKIKKKHHHHSAARLLINTNRWEFVFSLRWASMRRAGM